MERWFTVLDATGDLRSVGTKVTDQLPAGWTIVDLGELEESPEGVWNKQTKTFDPVPVNPDTTATKTIEDTPAVRTKLRSVVQGAELFSAAERDRVLAFVALQFLG